MANTSNTHKKELLKALAKSKGIVSTACESVGLSRTTFYEYVNTDEEFKQVVDEINEACIDWVESKLQEKINGIAVQTYNSKGEPTVYDQPPSDTAIIFYLKTRAKKRGYVERTELTGADGQPLQWNETKTYIDPNAKTDSGT